MNSVFDKIIEKLEEKHEQYINTYGIVGGNPSAFAVKECIDTVREIAEQYNNGWIPCSENHPKECVPVNITWINRNPKSYYAKIKDVPFLATAVYYNSKWYWYSSTCVDYLSEYGKNDFDLVDKDIDIIAWQPLQKPYQPKGE